MKYILLTFQNITQSVKNKLIFSKEITSKNNGDYCFLNCLHLFRTKSKLESHMKVCENKYFCNVSMRSEGTEILEINQYCKFDKTPFVSYADLDTLIEKIDVCKNNPEKLSTIKVSKHIPSGFPMSTLSSFKSIENKHDVYRGKDCMKKFCKSLREHALKIINFEKKKWKLLTKKQQKSYENACCIYQKNFEDKYVKDKNYGKVRDRFYYTGEYRGAAHSICNLKYNVPKKNPIVSHSRSNYDYHFIGTVSYGIQFIESARFMASLLLNLVDNLAEGSHKI